MMKALFLLGLVLLLSIWSVIPVTGKVGHPSASQIEHAPTPDQCRADADSWGIPTPALLVNTEQQFNTLAGATARDRSLTANMLEARMKELSQCIRTDKVYSVRYSEANRAYAIAQLARMGSFMKRHNLISQFLAEDEQGER